MRHENIVWPPMPRVPRQHEIRNLEPEPNEDDGGMMGIAFLAFALSGGLVGCVIGWILRGWF